MKKIASHFNSKLKIQDIVQSSLASIGEIYGAAMERPE